MKKLEKKSSNIFKHDDSIDFEIEILPTGIDLFYKEHYPSMQLHFKGF